MKNGKHTPGPWKVSTITTTNDWLIVNHEIQVARIPDAKFDVEHGESEANARLIAAAPDMLEALRELEARCFDLALSRLTEQERETTAKACMKAREVIRKAEGK